MELWLTLVVLTYFATGAWLTSREEHRLIEATQALIDDQNMPDLWTPGLSLALYGCGVVIMVAIWPLIFFRIFRGKKSDGGPPRAA